MEFSKDQLVFPYAPNSHLMTTFIMHNSSKQPISYKIKPSVAKRFIINPRQGVIRPYQSLTVEIAIHRQVHFQNIESVPNIDKELIQVIYGPNLQNHEKNKSKLFKLHLTQEQNRNARLNLTTIVQQTQQRVKKLQQQINEYKGMPITNSTNSKGKSSAKKGKLLNFFVLFVVGCIVGFFSPIDVFKIHGIHH